MSNPWKRRRHRPVLAGVLLLGLAALGCPPQEAPAAEPARVFEPKTDNTPAAGHLKLQRGAWVVPDKDGDGAIHITEDDTVLDLRPGALIGADDDTAADRYVGVGIRVEGAKNVTIRGGVVRGYKIGILAIRAPGLVLENIDASENFRQRLGSTPEREDPADWLWPHTNDKGEWAARYGAGFALTETSGAVVKRCRVRRGQNGLLLTRCERARVSLNDFSFNSGWGIALYRSTRCIVAGNHCDFCVRGYSHGVYARGQDSAGILVFEQSSDNTFVGNSATHSGDGFFLYAGHETTQQTGKGGCDRNAVFANDFSHAVANGIEATFSRENTFVGNLCNDCQHGIWAGYSADSLFGGNAFEGCTTAAISIEHGQDNRIVHNRITGGRAGIHLWWDHDKAFVDGVFGKARDTASANNLILGNDIRGANVGVKLVCDTGTALRWNDLRATEALLEFGAGTQLGPVENNFFRGIRSLTKTPPLLVRGPGAEGWTPAASNARWGRLRAPGLDLDAVAEALRLLRPPPRLPDRPAPLTSMVARRGMAAPRGRKHIHVDVWGPLDPEQPTVFPGVVRARGPRTTVRLVGQGTWMLTKSDPAVALSATKGTLPASVVISTSTAKGAEGAPAFVDFALEFEVAGRLVGVRGELLNARWRVAHFAWPADPRTDPEAWQAGAEIALEAAGPTTAPEIAFRWRTEGPNRLAADRFGTVATTTLRLAKGRYRLRTVSDDGVRVHVGATRVIDNWTHHAPTEDVGEIDLEAGVHVFRIDHFEIDGFAQLEFSLEKLR